MSENLTVYQTDKGEMKLSPSIVKKYLVSGNGTVTDTEIAMFIALCKYQNLNPFLREAYLIKFGTNPATIVTGKEVFTKRAAKIPECGGWNAGVILVNKDTGELLEREGTLTLPTEMLVGGWCKVHRKDWVEPMKITVGFEEYCRKDRDGKPMSSWKNMPGVMIRKVAIVTALRDAFPDDFQGMYAQEEMPVDANKLDEKPIVVDVELSLIHI